jgi:bisphosphoglycerate-dependent phosphoglycerate mutase
VGAEFFVCRLPASPSAERFCGWILLDLAMTGSADAEAVNDCLEPRIGTDWVIFRIDVDE